MGGQAGKVPGESHMESFWGKLKNELVHHRRYETRAQAKSEISEYARSSTTGNATFDILIYLAPAVFAQLHQNQVAA